LSYPPSNVALSNVACHAMHGLTCRLCPAALHESRCLAIFQVLPCKVNTTQPYTLFSAHLPDRRADAAHRSAYMQMSPCKRVCCRPCALSGVEKTTRKLGWLKTTPRSDGADGLIAFAQNRSAGAAATKELACGRHSCCAQDCRQHTCKCLPTPGHAANGKRCMCPDHRQYAAPRVRATWVRRKQAACFHAYRKDPLQLGKHAPNSAAHGRAVLSSIAVARSRVGSLAALRDLGARAHARPGR